jgi:hypothetical protein
MSLASQGHTKTQYGNETAKDIAVLMVNSNNMIVKKRYYFMEIFSLKRGLK